MRYGYLNSQVWEGAPDAAINSENYALWRIKDKIAHNTAYIPPFQHT